MSEMNPNLSTPQFQPAGYRRTWYGSKRPIPSPEAAQWLAEYTQAATERSRRERESRRT